MMASNEVDTLSRTGAVGCSTRAPATAVGDRTATVHVALLSSFEWQDMQDRKTFQFVNYSLTGPAFSAHGSFNSAEKNRIDGEITGVPHFKPPAEAIRVAQLRTAAVAR
jgi:hypothetical protein